MATRSTQDVQVNRPTSIGAAVALTVFTALATFPAFLLPGTDEVPTAVIVISIIGSLVLLYGAWGLWELRRWGAILTFVLTLLNVLLTLPAFTEAPSGWIVAFAAISIPLSIVALVLIALPSSRRVYR
jgi:hypothetical protein